MRNALAQLPDNIETCSSIGQMIVRNDQVGNGALFDKAADGRAVRGSGENTTPPAPQQAAHPVQNQRVVIDNNDKLSFEFVGRYRQCALRVDSLCPSAGRKAP